MTDEAAGQTPRIVAGSPTDDETAALAAVFAELLAERAAATTALEPGARQSAWSRSARPLRPDWAVRPVWGDARD